MRSTRISIVDAINFGLEAMRPVIDLQDRMRQEAGKAKRAVAIPAVDEALVAKVSEAALPGLKEGYGIARKLERYAKLDRGPQRRRPDADGRRPLAQAEGRSRSSSRWRGASSGR